MKRAISAWMSPSQQGLRQVLGNQGNLMTSGLLEQDIHGARITMQPQLEGVHAVDVGNMDITKHPHPSERWSSSKLKLNNVKERQDSHSWGWIARRQQSWQIPSDPAGKWDSWRGPKNSATAKYLHRVRQVLRSQLNGQNKIQAINTYDLPIIRYPAGIITQPKGEIEAIDVKTRRLLTMHGGFHPKSNWDCTLSWKREAED